ncbi:4874_t:CDS:2 [Cetraspora pellucida]|uniref:4874_t:CDS:1 n=1 Tax=Cetraspora pellucida TaxID=1433469 RepID=A0ACA9KW92_9GLOM|nr:4874_t:CDS:2 [Cetraspora pellucida]
MSFSSYLGLSVNPTSRSRKLIVDNNKNEIDYFFDYPLEVALPPICNSAEVKFSSYLGFSSQAKKEDRPIIPQKNKDEKNEDEKNKDDKSKDDKYYIESSDDTIETSNNMLIIREALNKLVVINLFYISKKRILSQKVKEKFAAISELRKNIAINNLKTESIKTTLHTSYNYQLCNS